MLVWLCQILFGAAALIAAGRAAWAVAYNERRGSYFLIVAGAFALIFFLTVPEVMPEMIALSILAMIAGGLLLPVDLQRSVHELIDEEIDFNDSTAARRLKH
ncbi:MAG: hypothetical protein JJE51_04015 [Thermoanaerobaculia bacterium]|nr:hypothetical protein [Thermoanaerobaculia bacterium]